MAALIALVGYASLRRWNLTRRWAVSPIVCLLLLCVHPAWNRGLGGGGDCGYGAAATSLFMTAVAGAGVFAQRHYGTGRGREGAPANGEGTRSPIDPPLGVEGVPGGEPAGAPAPEPVPGEGMGVRLLVGIVRRLFVAIPVVMFADLQYTWYRHLQWLQRHPKPNWVFGPLYFLLNSSPADDWIGYVLLAVAVPCLLSVVVWPNRWAALVASPTARAWVIPATVKALVDPS